MTIPPEIVDRVIDFAHNDFKTLVACSLVARDWVPSAYLHLFTKLRVLTAGDDARLKELTNSSPNLLRYCQELTLGGIYGEVGSTLGFLTFVKPLLTHPKRIDGFTSLHTLHIREFSSPPTDFIEFLVAISHKITTISIAECSFESRDDLWKVLRIFPNLQNVHTSRLGYSSSEEGELTVPPDCCHSPPIASFSVCTHCMGFVLQDLAGPPYPLTHLKSLEIHHTDQYQEKLNHVANKYRDVITTLKFGATSSIGCGAFIPTFIDNSKMTIAHSQIFRHILVSTTACKRSSWENWSSSPHTRLVTDQTPRSYRFPGSTPPWNKSARG